MGSTLRRWKQLVFHHEASPGVVLMAFAALALVLDNSSLSRLYESSILATPMRIEIGALEIDKPLLLWINDGLMAVFFLLVGLEIKREMMEGELSSWKQASLPRSRRFGGMLVPALIYVAVNGGNATGLSRLGDPGGDRHRLRARRAGAPRQPRAGGAEGVPAGARDPRRPRRDPDHRGVLYRRPFAASLAVAGGRHRRAVVLNLLRVSRGIAPYILVGIVMWVCVLKSGVHATLAGVVVALAIPLRARDGWRALDAGAVEHELVALGRLRHHAAVRLRQRRRVARAGCASSDLFAPVPLGIAAGPVLRQAVRRVRCVLAAVRPASARLPQGATWAQIYGVACLAGIGFTMSLFIGTLAFERSGIGAARPARRAGGLGGVGAARLRGAVARHGAGAAAGDAGSRPGTRGVTGQAQERLAPLAANWRTVPLRHDDEDLHLWQMRSPAQALSKGWLQARQVRILWSILPSGAGFL